MSRPSERRHAPRIELTIPVIEEQVSSVRKCTLINLSEVGLRYRKPITAERCEDQEVLLEFTLPENGKTIRVLSWVVDEIECGDQLEVGVTFMFLQDEDLAEIRRVVEEVLCEANSLATL